MSDHPDFETLEQFARTGEPEAVAAHLADCEECRSIVEGLRLALIESEDQSKSLDGFLAASEKSTLQQIKGRQKKKTPQRAWRALAIAAAVLLLLTAIWILPSSGSDLNEMVDGQIALTYAPPIQQRAAESGASKWADFRQSYIQENYTRAFALLEQVGPEVSTHELNFYGGLVLMYQDKPQYENALAYFDRAAETNNPFAARANWFKALCLIKLKRTAEARKVLVAHEGYKQTEATELLNLL